MNKQRLQDLISAIARGEVSPADAIEQLKGMPYQELDFAKIDSHRALRQGFPEVIFCPGKTPEQIVRIAQQMKTGHDLVLATRAEAGQAEIILPALPGAIYDQAAGIIVWGRLPEPEEDAPIVVVVSAGTADTSVAEEAAVVLAAHGVPVRRLYDVGVAGIHRLLSNMETFDGVCATIVIAGMDGALPSVVGGLLAGPVIAVPTSVGYGASFDGIAALLSMLNSCAAGLTVVNIDNGFGAAMAALRIVTVVSKQQGEPDQTSSASVHEAGRG